MTLVTDLQISKYIQKLLYTTITHIILRKHYEILTLITDIQTSKYIQKLLYTTVTQTVFRKH
jgi:hypothetical protein